MTAIEGRVATMRSEPEGFEAEVASALNDSFLDNDLWARLESPHGESWEGESMVERALRLYAFTSPIVEARVENLVEPVDLAVGVLRDIADACAIFARHWSEAEQSLLPRYDRAEAEAQAVSLGLLEWAASLGVELAVAEPRGVAPTAKASPEDGPDAGQPEELAASWSRVVALFRKAGVYRSTGRGSVIQTPEARDAASGLIAGAAGYMIWARRFHGSDPEVIAVGVTNLLAAQGFFVAAWDEGENDLFPSDEYLRRFLKSTGGNEWLAEHGAAVPQELRG